MKRRNLQAAIAVILCMLLLIGCTNKTTSSDANTDTGQNNTDSTQNNTGDTSSSDDDSEDSATSDSGVDSSSSAVTPSVQEDGTVTDTVTTSADIDVEFDSDDYYTNEISSDATTIKLNKTSAEITGSGATAKGSTITINSSGVYVISGTLEDGQIIVAANDKDDVQLILKGVSIQSSNSSPIYIQSADKVILSLSEGTTNTLTDTENYVLTDAQAEEPNAALFSKSDLVINGSGTLEIDANYNNAITSKDDLKITDATLKITSVDDGIIGRDSIAAKNAVITIQADGDGLKATNEEDAGKGFILLEGGKYNITSGTDGIQAVTTALLNNADITISSGDDGLHADSEIKLLNGTIEINKSYEGIESALVTVEDGNISVTSSDDGFNISGGADGSSVNGRMGQNDFNSTSGDSLTINGGYIYVNADGDGLDSNNNMYINGGTIIVNGPTNDGNGPMDYQGSCEITGGYLIAAGSSGMAQAPGTQSSQYSIGVLFSQTQSAGTLVHIEDSNGKTIATFAPVKQFSSMVVSSPDIKSGETYTVYTGGSSTGSQVNGYYSDGTYKKGTQMVEFTLADVVTWVNESGITEHTEGFGGGMGGPGGGGGGGMGGFGGGKRGH